MQGVGTSGYVNIAYFIAATTALYLAYSLHTAAYKGSTPGGAPRRGAVPEELVAIVGADGLAQDSAAPTAAEGAAGSTGSAGVGNDRSSEKGTSEERTNSRLHTEY